MIDRQPSDDMPDAESFLEMYKKVYEGKNMSNLMFLTHLIATAATNYPPRCRLRLSGASTRGNVVSLPTPVQRSAIPWGKLDGLDSSLAYNQSGDRQFRRVSTQPSDQQSADQKFRRVHNIISSSRCYM
jgi:hypothetical protein